MMTSRALATLAAAACATLVIAAQTPQQPPAGQPPAGQPPATGEIVITITGAPGLPPKLAVPDFIPLTNDAETVAAAKTIGQVLWDDLEYEREFYLIARDTYRTIPQATSIESVPLDRWKELNADGLVVGTVQKKGDGVAVQYRLIEVHSGRSALAKEYTGTARSIQPAEARLYAHTIADEIHKQQRGLDGVARTKLVFTSDRDGERVKGPLADRGISNLYLSDYDGARQQRLTITRASDISPVWCMDGRSIVFSSWRSGYQDIYLLFPYDLRRRMENPTHGTAQNQNYLPACSPDGSKIAFTSSRDGNPEIYTMNRDGSGVLRVTNHPRIDATPTWSPTGTQLAFTSDRSGAPQVYVVNADGTGLRQISFGSHSDRATWSPDPLNEIAYASRSGAGNDIKIFEFNTGITRTITDGIGNNESPAFAPNGRHLAFVSSRAGKEQIFTIARDGNDIRQITRAGVNRYPNWSALPRRD
jgi:TolB protein